MIELPAYSGFNKAENIFYCICYNKIMELINKELTK